jgi:hypothetical protein
MAFACSLNVLSAISLTEADYYPKVFQCSEIWQRRRGPKKMAQCPFKGSNPESHAQPARNLVWPARALIEFVTLPEAARTRGIEKLTG